MKISGPNAFERSCTLEASDRERRPDHNRSLGRVRRVPLPWNESRQFFASRNCLLQPAKEEGSNHKPEYRTSIRFVITLVVRTLRAPWSS